MAARIQTLQISLSHRKVLWRGRDLALSKRFFELYCLLALTRLKTVDPDGSYVDLEQIAQLPSWGKNTLLSIGKQISRHVQSMLDKGVKLIEGEQKVNGPFRLRVHPQQIGLDIEPSKLEASLGSTSGICNLSEAQQKRFYEFVEHLWRADRAFNDGKLKRALDYYDRAAQAAVLPHHRVMALCASARTLERQGAYGRALKVQSKATGTLGQTIEDRDWSEAKICATGAFIHWRKRELGRAEQFYRKALTLVARKRDHQLLGEIYNGLGLISKEREQYDQALRFYQQALESCVLAEDYYGIQAAYFNIGRVHSMFGDRLWKAGNRDLAKNQYTRAVDWIRQCIALCDHLAIADDMSDDRILLSHVYRRLGQIERALQAATTANEMALRAGNQRCIALSYRELAGVHLLRGQAELVMADIENCKRNVSPQFLEFLREEEILRRLKRVNGSLDSRTSRRS